MGEGHRVENVVCEDADGAAWVLADGQRLRQIVGNLLSNAIRFTDKGAVTLMYGMAWRPLTLAVSDTGVSILQDRQAALRRHGTAICNVSSR